MKKDILSKDQIKHIAKLANLSLDDKELQIYTRQLASVLNYMEILQEVDTKHVPPTYQVLDRTTNIYREDVVGECFSQKEAISQGKKIYEGFFTTRNVFEEARVGNRTLEPSQRKVNDKYNAILTTADPKGVVGHKDLFMTKGIETTAGSRVLEGYIPQYNSTVVSNFEKAGLKTKYKLNQDAWGHGSSGENSDFGPTKNPWNTKKVAGGSSSGSVVVVATGKVDVATATDTCGSIRMPSSYCNVCGIKPTYGAVSRYGVIAFASSLDCPGVLSNSVENLQKYFDLISAKDSRDATSQSESREKKMGKLKRIIGVPMEFLGEGIDSEVKKIFLKAVEIFKKANYKIIDVSLPHTKYGIAAYYILAPTETASNLARYDGVRYGNDRSYFGPEAKRRIMLGTFVSSAGYTDRYYEKAARIRTLIIRDLEKAYDIVDAILAPVSPIPPFNIGEKVDDPLQLYLMDIYAAPASLSGTPSLAIPCGFTKDELPVGMQIMGPRWSEEMLFELGEEYQKATQWHKFRPNSKEMIYDKNW
ncbi:MAG: Glutamyl-tRNA(Gln) amidotransferase subunit A [Candidatus Woesebacteria bacterium GW2011_GWB1_39_12]|uniref:Multifunctional fusion protein n=2 Tax=Candidatus Woeseibacteriota TaxID=1752722 RepID=A0A0G0M3A3_9BACT|nr:MAG: Glutamyl-tRNA(Gln) amidotransferase subunit A [Candidatus Woesebacteria bacterium GW2011_GWA1_39_12]KKR00482.1 MAG: Glutamyl-tRNA(Gln) amidotransferase subunit A [Candidatus Woesebacteria bacterium GW2011_GWB1_39_12]